MGETLYCSAEDVASQAGPDGVDAASDDHPARVEHARRRATADVDFYLRPRYSPEDLVGNPWVASRCLDLAIYYLFGGRLNPRPETVVADHDRAVAQLEAVQKGTAAVPGASRDKGSVPTLTTQRVVLGANPAIRTEVTKSTGTADGYPRRVDRSDFGPFG